MQFVNSFGNRIISKIPSYQPIVQLLMAQSKLVVNYDIDILSKQNKISFYSKSHIPANTYILLTSNDSCLFSSCYQGATRMQEKKIDQYLQKLQSQNTMSPQQLKNLKILIQIIANSSSEQLPANKFSKWIQQQQPKNILTSEVFQSITSQYLKSILSASIRQSTKIYENINEQFLKIADMNNFLRLMQVVRNDTRSLYEEKVLAPFLHIVNHSFKPNCTIQGLYLSHLRQSMVTIKSKEQIFPQQQLTINYGNFNNIELFLRFGFTIQNNPYNQVDTMINLEKYPQFIMQNIDWKQQKLKDINEKFKYFIKVKPDGTINEKDFEYLKIMTCNRQNQYGSIENINKIKTIIRQQVKNNLQMIQRIPLPKTNHIDIDRLQNQQREIPALFLKNFK